ncbi:keratinocyte proline-rich protein [Plutella xylostella]|uniref:keratinocyte proline-rich protein n=1 Tax=Plutella xylostella TaxID=51655 RepID=UPI002032A281|nr:keratinocyte proline-rich protein [Plutella xylostella]
MGGVFSSHECRAGCGGARCCSCATPIPGCPAPAAGCPFDQGCHFPAPPCPPPEPACLPRLGFLSTCPQQPSFSSNLFGGSQFSSSHNFSGTGSQVFPCPQNSFGKSSNCQCPPNSFGRSSNCQCPPKVISIPMFGPNQLKQMFSSKSFQSQMGPGQMCGGQSMRQMCPAKQQSCAGSPSGQMFPGQMCPARSSIRFECPPQPACPPPCPPPCPAPCPAAQPQMKPQRCCDPKLCAQYDQMYGGTDSLSSVDSIPDSCEEEQKEKCCGSKRKLYRDNRCGSSTIIGSMQEVRSERQRRMVCRDPSHHGGCGKSRRVPVRPPPQPGCPAGACCSSSREVRPRRPGPTCSRPSSQPCSRPSSQPSSCCGSKTNLHSGSAPCQRSKKSRSKVTVQEPKAKRTPRPTPRSSTRSIPQYEEEYSEESEEAPPVCPAPCLKRRPPRPRPRPPPPPPPPPPEYRDYNTNNEGPDLYKNSKSKASDFLRIFLVLGGECCKILLQLVFLLRQYLGKMCNEVMTRKKCYTQRCCGS